MATAGRGMGADLWRKERGRGDAGGAANDDGGRKRRRRVAATQSSDGDQVNVSAFLFMCLSVKTAVGCQHKVDVGIEQPAPLADGHFQKVPGAERRSAKVNTFLWMSTSPSSSRIRIRDSLDRLWTDVRPHHITALMRTTKAQLASITLKYHQHRGDELHTSDY